MIRLRFPARMFALALAAGLPFSADAAGIGQAHVLSRLGQPLHVEIELSGLTEHQSVPNCYSVDARLPSAAPIAGLREAPLELVARPSGTRLLFKTVTPVSEPLIRIQMRASCGIELLRSFDLMLPLASEAADVVVPASESLVAPVPPAAAPAPRPAARPAPRPAARPKSEIAAPAAAAAAAPAQPAPATPGAMISDPAQQAVLSAATQLAAAKTDAERAAIVARLQQSLTPAASDVPPAADRAAAPSAQAPAAAETPREIPKVAAPQPPVVEDEGFPVWWVFLGGLLATLGYWLWHRHRLAGEATAASVERLRVNRAARETPAPVAVSGSAAASPVVINSDAANIFRDPPPIAAAADLGVADPATTVSPLQERLAMRSTHPDFDPDMPMPQVEQFDEEAEVIELAELMLQFGRVSGAVDTLRGYLDEAPKAALLPWLRLLEIYRQANQRAEFEDAARHLNRHFNVQVVTWEQANANAEADANAPQTLEGYPRALDGVVESWGTAAGLDYLNELLRDNRDGARVGFPPEVAKEILFLISVLKEALVGEASAANVRSGVAA